jgi:DNA-binding helix-hairpin-helix protein with protein kinase domain
MNSPPSLVDRAGQPVPLDRPLASGGEGAVFSLANDPARVAKVYHRPPTPEAVAKLTAMVGLASPRLLSVAAWPVDLLFDPQSRELAGFIMPRLSDCQPVQHLYNPVQRLTCFPRAGWDFQVRAARNLAAAFDDVHAIHCLIGDVNQSNVQVSARALVRLIDCDSFQVRADGNLYACDVGVAHYTPPELQGKPLRGLTRTENHDRFGLAVLIYQLLFVGRHPYAGVYSGKGDPSFEQLIADFRFAQGPAARTWGMAPPPHTPTFADISADLGTLFRRAFERGSEAGTRATPAEWIAALDGLEKALVQCPADLGHKYWRGAGACVWCRLAANGGPEYYFGVAADAGTFTVDEAKLKDVRRRLSACALADFPYERRRFVPARPPTPEPLPAAVERHRTTTRALALALGLCTVALPVGLVQPAVAWAGLAGVCLFGASLALHAARSPRRREARRRLAARGDARRGLDRAEEEWRQTVTGYRNRHAELTQALGALTAECRGLAAEYRNELQGLAATAESRARARHLRLHLIADADIPNVGAGRKQVLASHGVVTAADVEPVKVRGIKAFGAASAASLLQWKVQVLGQFRLDPATAVAAAERNAITARFGTRQQEILAEVGRLTAELQGLAPDCRAALHNLVPELRRALARCAQAEADLAALGAPPDVTRPSRG